MTDHQPDDHQPDDVERAQQRITEATARINGPGERSWKRGDQRLVERFGHDSQLLTLARRMSSGQSSPGAEADADQIIAAYDHARALVEPIYQRWPQIRQMAEIFAFEYGGQDGRDDGALYRLVDAAINAYQSEPFTDLRIDGREGITWNAQPGGVDPDSGVVVLITSSPNQRWPIHENQTLEQVLENARNQQWCELHLCGAACINKMSENKRSAEICGMPELQKKPIPVPLPFGNLIIVVVVCAACMAEFIGGDPQRS
ncbi:MAG: hypothetical protein JST91_26530 [Actinobacteria bacterium]|nr:hypothetical protein [Actinomycetota bacterium]